MGTSESIENNSSCGYCPIIKQKHQQQYQKSNNHFLKLKNLNFNNQSTFKKLQITATQYCSNMQIDSQYIPLIIRLLAYNHYSVFDALQSLESQNSKLQLVNKICEIDLDMIDSLYSKLVVMKGNIVKEKKQNQLKKQAVLLNRQKNSNNNNRSHDSNYNNNNSNKTNKLKPLSIPKMSIEDKIELQHKGRTLLTQGKVGIVFMCSGPSSRFYFQDKFLHPLEIDIDSKYQSGSTILEILFEKLRENILNSQKQSSFVASRNNNRSSKMKQSKIVLDIPIVLIGNQTNTQLIEQYVRQNNFFNFNKHSIFFSTIPSLPILNKQGKICMNFEYNYLRRPQGSAFCLQQIANPQAMQILRQKGVEYVHVVGTENLAQSPGDPMFVGLTKMLKRNVAIKCTKMSSESKQYLGKFDEIRVGKSNRLQIISKFQFSHQKQQQYYHQQQNLDEDNNYHFLPMNSMLFQLETLPQIVQKFNYNPQQKTITPSYKCYQIKQNLYDFKLKKPLINQKCYTFQKDIKDTICVSDRPLVVEVQNQQFLPIISHKGDQGGVQQAVEKYLKKAEILKKQRQEQQMKKRNHYEGVNNHQPFSYQQSSLPSSSSSTKSIQRQRYHKNNNQDKVTNKQRHNNKNHQYLLTE